MGRSLFIIAVLALTAALAPVHAAGWVPLQPGAVAAGSAVRVISSNSARTTLELVLTGINVEERNVAGTTWQVITLPVAHAGLPAKAGSPQLPLVARLVAVGPLAGVRVNVLELEEQTLTGYNVYPLQPAQREDRPVPPFTRDDARYTENAFYPDNWAVVGEPAVWRDYRVVPLVIQPVRCNPVTGELKVARRLKLELVAEGSGPNPLVHRPPFVSRTFGELYREYIANYNFLPPTSPLTGTYLIVTNDTFYNDVLPLADWKLRKGWRVKTVKTSELGGTDSAHVATYLHNAYLNWPYPPDYVLLVGDVEFIACGYGSEGVATDHCYTQHAGSDYLSEFLIARISVKNHTECQTVVNKLVAYETDPDMANPHWFHKAASIGGYESGWPDRFWTCCIQCRDEMLGHSPITQFDTLFQRWGQATPANVTNAVNEGRSWLLYRGHGDVDGWYNVSPAWTNSNVQALANGRMAPMVVGPTCLSGRFNDANDCHAETWLKVGTPTQAQGGIGYFGSSEPSYTGHNDSLALGTFVGYCESLSFSMTQSTYNGKLYMYRAYPPPNSTTQLEFDMFNSFGDPELQVWSNTPAELLVNHPATVRIGATQFPVTVSSSGPVANALVCVMCPGDTSVWQNGYTDAGGQVTFNVNCTQPGESLYVTVTGRNLAPYLGAAIVVASNSPYVTHLRHTVNDDLPGGNGDGIVNPGEAITLPLWVKNWGSAAANGVTALLGSVDPMVTVTDSLRSLGNIAAGDSAFTGAPGFGFTVSPACSNGYALRFSLVCRDANDSFWTSQFSIRCGTGVFDFADKRVYDPGPGGNGNGRIDPGETAELFVSLRNTGLGNGYNVRAVLRSGDSRFQVTDSVGVYGSIPHDSTRENSADPFVVHADNGIPKETPIACTLCVTADGGYARMLGFTVIIGELRSTDPIPDDSVAALYYAYDDIDSSYTEHPDFNWHEIRGLGTQLTLSDDQTATLSLPSGFGPWKYYGQRYNSISVCGNGFVMPGSSSVTAWTNAQLPTSTLAAPAICLNWDDLYPPTGGGVWWYHDTVRHAFIVEWDSVAYYSPRTTFDAFQVLVMDTTLASGSGENEIVVQYRTANGYGSNTTGIQNADYTRGINCLFNGSYHRAAAVLRSGSAIKYTCDVPVNAVAEPARASSLKPQAPSLTVWPSIARDNAWIRWQLPAAGPVSLRLYDISGKHVATLVQGVQPAGAATINLRVRDFATGVYFCKLRTGNRGLTCKLVMAR